MCTVLLDAGAHRVDDVASRRNVTNPVIGRLAHSSHREAGEEIREVVDEADSEPRALHEPTGAALGVPRPDPNGPVAVRGVLPAHTT